MHTNPDGFKKIITRYSKVTDPGMLQGTVQYAYDFVEKVPLVKRDAFQNTITQIAARRSEANQAKPEQFYDNTLVRELVKEGFFKLCGAKRSPPRRCRKDRPFTAPLRKQRRSAPCLPWRRSSQFVTLLD